MSLLRGFRLFNNIVNKNIPKKSVNAVVPARSSHEFFYRSIPEPAKIEIIFAELLGGFMWWWILWHMWHDWGHVVGEFPYPDPSKWTDEELGIPPED